MSIRRSARIRNHSTINGNRYSGQKRRNIDSQSDTSDNDYSSTNDENTNPNKRRRLSKDQSRARSRTRYVIDKNKWKQKQTSNQRRSTRIKYRNLADSIAANRSEIMDIMSNKFIKTIDEQNAINDQVCHPNEAFMDMEQTKHMANILREQTRSLANEQFTITPNDQIASIIRHFGEDNEGDEDEQRAVKWSAIGKTFAIWFLTVPPIQFMNGRLQQSGANEKAKKVRQVRKKKAFTTDAPKVEPKKVTKTRRADKTETKSRVTHLKKSLRHACDCSDGQNGVNPFEFLINPQSYSQTIENLFDLSFIMNQGFAQMEVSQETEQPILSYISTSERLVREKSNEKHNGQCVIKFNPNMFVSLIDVYQIEESQIERADQMNGHCNGYERKGHDKEEAD